MMHKLAFLVASGGFTSFLSNQTIYAQSRNHVTKLKLSELPFYDIDEKSETFKVGKEKVSKVRQLISEARKLSCDHLEIINNVWKTAKNTMLKAKEHNDMMVKHVRDEAAGFTRVTIITIAGLGGIVFGYRGGILRKWFYGSLAATAAGAFCYPKVAFEFSIDAWDLFKNSSREILNQIDKSQSFEKEK